ncbi:MAG: RecB family exonuclease [Thermoplasmatota archaeon]
MPRVYSPSRIASYENCPLKFKYRYVDKKPAMRATIEAFMGQRVHEALEKLYRDKQFEKTPSLEDLVAFYHQQWEKEMNDDICVVKDGYDPGNYRTMGEKYIRQYYQSYQPFDDGTTIALEQRVRFPLGDGHSVMGYIDRLADNDGTYEVHDYKTSLTLPTTDDLRQDRQLALYALAVRHMYDDADEVELVWHYVAFDKELRVQKSDTELQSVRQETLEAIQEIEMAIRQGDFEARQSGLCPYCEYQPLCPLFKHKYQVDELPAEDAREEDGRALVNRYAELKAKIAELEQLKDDVQERLVRYAENNDAQYVYGSDRIANVKVYHNPWFPNQDDPQRDEFEKLLRETGLYDEYTRLDTFALSKAFQKNELPDEAAEKLQPYVTTKTMERVYLRQRDRD